jgi:Zn-dependent peptidase ImmA (M78 family)
MRADELLEDLKMDGEIRPDPVRVCERARIKVRMTEEVEEPKSWTGENPAIWLPRRSCGRARDFHFDLAHEIHHCIERRRCDNAELSANVFAGALLLPTAHFRAEWDRHPDFRQLQKVWWNVPPTSVVLRVGELSLADTWIYQRDTLRYARAQRALDAAEVDAALQALKKKRAEAVPGVRAARLADGPHRLAFVRAA